MIPRVEYVRGLRFWRIGLYRYDRSTVLACGPVQLRWRRA